MKALILAAGRGERLRPLTDTLPKPLLPVAGRPLIEHQVRRLVAAGFRELVVNTAWLGALIEARLGDGARFGAVIRYSREPEGALETAGGIRHALPLLGEPAFLVVNADVWCELDLGRLALAPAASGQLVLVPNPAHHPAGDFTLDAGVVGVPAAHPAVPTFTFAGIALYRARLFAELPPGRQSLAPLLRTAAAAGVLRGELYRGTWLDVGTADRLAEVDALARASSGNS